MSALLGIIHLRSNQHEHPSDQQCLDLALRKFPNLCKGIAVFKQPGLQVAGHLTTSTIHPTSTHRLFLFGEVFNQSELIKLLSENDVSSTNIADIIEALFVKYGCDITRKINGQFLIIRYQLDNHSVQLMTDHLGVQQIVYHQQDNLLLFGSDLKLLMTHPACPKKIDWAAALRRPLPHIVLGTYKSRQTWFEGISLLPEAGILHIDTISGNINQTTYWTLQQTQPAETDNRSVQEIMTQYAALLDDAVQLRMQPNATTHSLLSGGLDSSAICALAAKYGKLHTYSIINQTTVLEETTSYCAMMANELNFQNEQYLIPYHQYCFNLKRWMQRVWRGESPVNHTDSFTKTMLHAGISSTHNNVQFVLSGTGSDQLNGGLAGYVAQKSDAQEESWENFYNEIIDTENRSLIKREEDGLWTLRHYINRPFLSDISGIPMQQNYWLVCVENALHSQAFTLIWDEQRASASQQRTTRYPFMDYRMAEFIAAVPINLHPELFYDKQILREPAKQFVPDYIVHKPKMPYNLPEYDFRAELYAFLTSTDGEAYFHEAFGDPDSPHPVINKRYLYNKIKALQQKPIMTEWLSVIHILNLGLLEQLSEKDERDLCYEDELGAPTCMTFDDIPATIQQLQRDLDILTTNDLLQLPLRFGEDCSLLFDTRKQVYVLARKNVLMYEIDDEYIDWKNFLLGIDQQKSTADILSILQIPFSNVQEFFMIALKDQIFVTSDKQTGY